MRTAEKVAVLRNHPEGEIIIENRAGRYFVLAASGSLNWSFTLKSGKVVKPKLAGRGKGQRALFVQQAAELVAEFDFELVDSAIASYLPNMVERHLEALTQPAGTEPVDPPHQLPLAAQLLPSVQRTIVFSTRVCGHPVSGHSVEGGNAAVLDGFAFKEAKLERQDLVALRDLLDAVLNVESTGVIS